MKKCEPQRNREAYFRICLCVPENGNFDALSIQHRINQVIQHEGRVLTTNGILFAVDHMQTLTNGIRLALCHQLLHDLGYEHIFDKQPRKIQYEVVIPIIRPHVQNIAKCVELKTNTSIVDLKSLVKFVNTVLSTVFKIKLSKKKDDYTIKHFNFPSYRFVKSFKPFVSTDLIRKANLQGC